MILYATLDIWETTSKGPYLLGDNLGVMLLGSHKFVPSNQTLDLTGNGEWRGRSLIQDSCALRCASWASRCRQFYILSYNKTDELKCT